MDTLRRVVELCELTRSTNRGATRHGECQCSVHLYDVHVICAPHRLTRNPGVPARAVVSQFYVTEAENEYVIRANSAIMKCKIPSFVSEFVQVDQWVADDGTIYTAGQEYGRREDGW